MKKVFILGASGQLGRELKQLCPEAICSESSQVDLRRPDTVEDFLTKVRPDLLINCAGHTQVDQAETNREEVFKINAECLEMIAKIVPKVVHISTDYVFNGRSSRPYTELDLVDPINTYGESKALGESILLGNNPDSVVIRTSWMYSASGRNFVKTIDQLCSEKDSLNIVCDQVGSPTYARDLANVIVNHAINSWDFSHGVYHYTNEGSASWYEFALEIKKLRQHKCEIHPILSEQYKTAARRPFYSVLDKSKIKSALGIEIPEWKNSLKYFLSTLS